MRPAADDLAHPSPTDASPTRRDATSPAPTGTATSQTREVCTLGIVSFLNSRPLMAGLDEDPALRLVPAVPSALYGLLREGAVDVALLPVVDIWRGGSQLQLVSDACIASSAETMTVRIFSRVPPDRIRSLLADPDSHTSVILARLLWREMYGRDLELHPWKPGQPADRAEAVLLIGDKVVADAPRGYGFEVDLGGAWRHLTDLPFVFAAWAGPTGRDLGRVAAALSTARDRGVAEAGQIAEKYAAAHQWPVSTARRYLSETLLYRLTPAARAGMSRFLESAERIGLLTRPAGGSA